MHFQSDQGSALCRRGWHVDTKPVPGAHIPGPHVPGVGSDETITLLTYYGPPVPSTNYVQPGDDPRIHWIECPAAVCGRGPGPIDVWFVKVIGAPGTRWATTITEQEIAGMAAEAKREAECCMRNLGWVIPGHDTAATEPVQSAQLPQRGE